MSFTFLGKRRIVVLGRGPGAALEFLSRWHSTLAKLVSGPVFGEMMFVVFSGQEVAGGDPVIEARTVRDCNVHGDAWVRIRKQLVGGDCQSWQSRRNLAQMTRLLSGDGNSGVPVPV
jgi:hypothetical protein